MVKCMLLIVYTRLCDGVMGGIWYEYVWLMQTQPTNTFKENKVHKIYYSSLFFFLVNVRPLFIFNIQLQTDLAGSPKIPSNMNNNNNNIEHFKINGYTAYFQYVFSLYDQTVRVFRLFLRFFYSQ